MIQPQWAILEELDMSVAQVQYCFLCNTSQAKIDVKIEEKPWNLQHPFGKLHCITLHQNSNCASFHQQEENLWNSKHQKLDLSRIEVYLCFLQKLFNWNKTTKKKSWYAFRQLQQSWSLKLHIWICVQGFQLLKCKVRLQYIYFWRRSFHYLLRQWPCNCLSY